MRVKIGLTLALAALALIMGAMCMNRKTLSPISNAERDLGFSLPADTIVILVEQEPGLSSKITYLKLKMRENHGNRCLHGLRLLACQSRQHQTLC